MTKHINGQAGRQGVTDLQRRIACLRRRIGELEECVKRRNNEIHELRVANAKLRELVQTLYVNLCNREAILELMGMPPSEAAKGEVRAIIDKCSELGIEVES